MSRRRKNPARRGERGSASVELVLLTPVLIVVLLFVVGLARIANARQEVEAVAADGARAASLERNTAHSARAARSLVEGELGDRGMSCVGLKVDVDISDYRPGGSVRVTVSCTAALGDVALSGLPGSKQFRATAVVPIETHRGS